MPVSRHAARVKKRTSGSMRVSPSRGISEGASATSGPIAQAASAIPRAPPRTDSSRLSVRSWRTIRPVPLRARGGSELPLPGRGPREQQVRDVGAGDQEHEPHRPEEDPERRSDLAEERVAQRTRNGPVAGVGLGIRLLEVAHDAGELGPRRFEARPGSQPAERAHPRVISPFEPGRLGAVQADRRIQSHRFREEGEAAGQHADDDVGKPVELNRRFRRSTDPRRSAFATSRRDRSTVRSAPGRSSAAWKSRPRAGRTPRSDRKGAEISAPRRSSGSRVPLTFQRRPAVSGERSGARGLAPASPGRWATRRPCGRSVRCTRGSRRARSAQDREGSEQHGAHDAEDRGVRPDAEGERRDGHEREAGGLRAASGWRNAGPGASVRMRFSYSARSARIGSIEAARRAGIQQASAAQAASRSADRRVGRRIGRRRCRRESSRATGSRRARRRRRSRGPGPSGACPRRAGPPTTRPGSAPSAMRTPISAVRCFTDWLMTPAMPTEASRSASPAKRSEAESGSARSRERT